MFNQGIGGTFDLILVTESAQQSANERRFAGTQIAFEPNAHARHQEGRQRGTKRQGCQLIGQEQNRSIIIAGKLARLVVHMHSADTPDWSALATNIKKWGCELGFDSIGIASAILPDSAETGLLAWLEAGYQGQMDYMARHGRKRAHPEQLLPGTISVITARIGYWPDAAGAQANLADSRRAYVSRYALGRDYHKLMRNRLQQLADRIANEVGTYTFRVFTDSAPVLEVELARQGGLGWRGKHTLLLTREAGSYFFLGEICCALPLPPDRPQSAHCGTCTACISACPTGAIVAPYRLDARRCISYLTIELKGSIPLELRPSIGNRIYGCDDCQLCCPWNMRSLLTRERDFAVRHALDQASLVQLFAWSEAEFKQKMVGSAIYRIGHERWLRNIAVGLGNAPSSPEVLTALRARRDDASALVREHVAWALEKHAC